MFNKILGYINLHIISCLNVFVLALSVVNTFFANMEIFPFQKIIFVLRFEANWFYSIICILNFRQLFLDKVKELYFSWQRRKILEKPRNHLKHTKTLKTGHHMDKYSMFLRFPNYTFH